MPHSAHRAAPVPLTETAYTALWVTDADGTILVADGDALAQIRTSSAEVVGRSLYDVYEGRADLVAVVTRVLSGIAWAGTLEYGGALWLVRLQPIPERGGLVGFGHILRVGSPSEAVPEPQEDGVHRWLVTQTIRAGGIYWPVGTLVAYDGHAVVRCTAEDTVAGLTALRSHADRIDYLLSPSESSPTPPDLSPRTSSAKARLSVVRGGRS